MTARRITGLWDWSGLHLVLVLSCYIHVVYILVMQSVKSHLGAATWATNHVSGMVWLLLCSNYAQLSNCGQLLRFCFLVQLTTISNHDNEGKLKNISLPWNQSKIADSVLLS